MMLIDGDQRSQATDPCSSFIVQAPAGSGKTEILTQRYLRLLSTVTEPEQIIALTFTRKAASEMRERIVLALQDAANNSVAKSAHQQMTLEFAKEALRCSEQHQWELLQQPNRLKIITIDSLCQSINQAIPLMEKHIAYSNITDKPGDYYLKAARLCIQFAIETPDYQPAIKRLLLHVDNRQDKLIQLFHNLLSQRDQWLGPLFQARSQEKSSFEQALQSIEDHELHRFKNSIPTLLAHRLTQLAQELASIENNPESPRFPLRNWFDFNKTTRDIAAALSKLLLTNEGKFRNAFDHHVGLKRGIGPDEDYNRLKEDSKKLLEDLAIDPNFLDSLIQVSHLPNPEYDPEQWEVLQALFSLLPLLVGHLHVLFSDHNEVDFAAISQQALAALGDNEAPTDLALYLDNSIHHLLVDEFQDTSITQYELLNKLVQGWQAGDGKTLFVVGDPMQSIYRFRQAEVGLFFRAKEQGIGPVMLKSLELRCNFRSTETIVNWVNQHFAHIFPKQVDIESGAVSFHPSAHVIKGGSNSTIQAFQFANRDQEAQRLIQLVTTELASDEQGTMAILVRSRTQLVDIIRLLRQNHISYQGTDIDLLASLPHLRDVWSLTQALLLPGNRLAWLAMLRSPYCGLSLSDIYGIASYNKNKSIYLALKNLKDISISEEGRKRAAFFVQVMDKALSNRYQLSLSDWVAQTLKELHLDKILKQNELNDLEQFWTLLDRYEQEGRLPDLKEFQKEMNKLYSQQNTPSRLQVMTIHKSKGLEFDTVFLPGLGAQPNRGDSPMLRCLKLPSQDQGTLFLMSPIQAAHQDHCELYDYLGQLDEEKSHYEAQRVLYVAVTRAKSRLFLLDSSTKNAKGSFRGLLKHLEFIDESHERDINELGTVPPKILTLPTYYFLESKIPYNPYLNEPSPPLSIENARLAGIVAHLLLEWICENHPQSTDDIPWNLAQSEFRAMGWDTHSTELAMQNLQFQINQLFQDPIGLWVISKHDKEINEYELLVEHQNNLVTRIIDRTFVFEGNQWIIDFKTGKEDKESLLKHQQQLNEYAFYLSSKSHLPIRCGLYYLGLTHWVHWRYEAATNLA